MIAGEEFEFIQETSSEQIDKRSDEKTAFAKIELRFLDNCFQIRVNFRIIRSSNCTFLHKYKGRQPFFEYHCLKKLKLN